MFLAAIPSCVHHGSSLVKYFTAKRAFKAWKEGLGLRNTVALCSWLEFPSCMILLLITVTAKRGARADMQCPGF